MDSEQVAFCLSVGLLIMAVLMFIFLICYIVATDLKSKNHAKDVATQFNISLSTISISQIGIYACLVAAAYTDTEALNDHLVSVLLQIFIGNVQTSYVYFSYHRSQAILKRSMKRLQNFVTFLLPISPLFFYAQVIPELALAFNTGEYSQDAVRAIEYTCPLLAGTGAVIFDTIFLYAFCAHLSATGMIDLEFMTIRKYGIITCLLCYLSLGLYVLAAAVPELENDYTLIVVVCNGIFLVIFGVMFQMKIAMRELAESERAESVDVVRKNIQESRKELSSQRKNTSSPLIFVTSA